MRIGYISSKRSSSGGRPRGGGGRRTQKANLLSHLLRIAVSHAVLTASDAVGGGRTTPWSRPISARRSRRSRHFECQVKVSFHWRKRRGAWLIVSVIVRSTSRTRMSGAGGGAGGATVPVP